MLLAFTPPLSSCLSPRISSSLFTLVSFYSSALCRCGSAESVGYHPIQHSGWRPDLHHIPAPHDHAQHQAQHPRLPATGTSAFFLLWGIYIIYIYIISFVSFLPFHLLLSALLCITVSVVFDFWTFKILHSRKHLPSLSLYVTFNSGRLWILCVPLSYTSLFLSD